jgi:hypothetical protein
MVDSMGDDLHLAMLLTKEYGNWDDKGTVIVYDNQYNPSPIVLDPVVDVDMHEINIQDPHRALALAFREENLNMASFGLPDVNMNIWTGGFVEFDITTGKVLLLWTSQDAISPDESVAFDPYQEHPNTDFMHVNSIDRNKNGDYMLSARHTSTLYFISGQDGRIMWRLGGKRSDFAQDFEFSYQHDAKFISVNDTHITISFLNNGAEDIITNEPTSSAMYVELDLTTMKATLLNRYTRPDHESTRKRGNMQTLPNGNVLVGWSEFGYMSEFTHDGRLLMEARFVSERFSTYRAYKFPWRSRPSYPPVLVASCHGVNGTALSTTFHVSWNGATDVKYWRFFTQANLTGPSEQIAIIPKKSFETSFAAHGYLNLVSVEALDMNFQVLGQSATVRTQPPVYWPEGVELLKPDDSAAVADEDSASTRKTLTFVGLFVAGFLTSTSVYLILSMYHPTFRRYLRRTYSRVQSEDTDEGVGLLNLNA